MTARPVQLLVLVVGLLSPGCVAEAVKDQAARTAAAQHGYDRLIRASIGEGLPADGVAVVTSADLEATPASVRELLTNLTRSFYKNANAWLVLDHAANDAAEVTLTPPAALVPPGGP